MANAGQPRARGRGKKPNTVSTLIFCIIILLITITQLLCFRACRDAEAEAGREAVTASASDAGGDPAPDDTAARPAIDPVTAPPATETPTSETTTTLPPQPVEVGDRVIDASKPIIALTFDDGPCPDSNRLLDILEANGAVATFFEQGHNVERYPDIVKRELELGCEIGNHTYSHQRLTELSAQDLRAQVVDANNAFINACGVAPKLLRPPYGRYGDAVRELSKELDMYIILWSVDTLDWKLKDADKTYASVMEQAYDGAVMLMHSVHSTTVDAAERFIPDLAAQGYQFVTVSELAALRGVEMEPGIGYGKFKQS